MPQKLTLGISPCPNDTYIFYGLAKDAIDLGDYAFDLTLLDVEELNTRAQKGLFDVVKMSVAAYPYFAKDYALLPCGGALGRGVGPIVVTKPGRTLADLKNGKLAIPGKMTTANLLVELCGKFEGERVELRYDKVMPAVASGEVDAGVVIHEGRFTFAEQGLEKVMDLGQWWEGEFDMPLPLGAIAIKRSLGEETARDIARLIRASLGVADENMDAAWPWIVVHAQEMEPDVIRSHIKTFVTEYSRDVGEDGRRAIEKLVQAAFRVSGVMAPDKPLFVG